MAKSEPKLWEIVLVVLLIMLGIILQPLFKEVSNNRYIAMTYGLSTSFIIILRVIRIIYRGKSRKKQIENHK